MKNKIGFVFMIVVFIVGLISFSISILPLKNGMNLEIYLKKSSQNSKIINMKKQKESAVLKDYVVSGTKIERGYLVNNILHSSDYGEIHYSSYIPKNYDKNKYYSLFITLSGWKGLYFQGVGENIRQEDFGITAREYNNDMIILAPQLNDWGETSADQTIELTEYFLKNYNIDSSKVYLEGYSGGGETGSIVMGKTPELYSAFLHVSSKWSGNIDVLSKSRTPIYMVTGREDSYYGSDSVLETYQKLYNLYLEQGLKRDEIDKILVIDIKENKYFLEKGYYDSHAGGVAFAKDKYIMSWLFSNR